ncbi:MAG: 16S rRNA (uracil(1498)-N(3))-methyltransferase [Deltaproteobacteria bacterium]|nr:16S rRNA (uracil(1498)-N(3))-methyltransferase [Deltaproteobacteria bacterium]MBI3293399.1 16S rRNA (uracil(1498)-N(3))-methyltransferase [Deltaproteobacteria bacterium]
MNRFLSPQRLTDQSEIRLDETETHHLTHVLRTEAGEKVLLVDGEGGQAVGRVVSTERSGAHIVIQSIERMAKPSHFGLAFGIPKAAALEFILRRCTEIGVTDFQPLVTQHSHPSSFFNADRWKRVVAEVSKQCQRLHFPALLPPLRLGAYLSRRDETTPVYLCSETDREERPSPPKGDAAEILIGSEGGWSEEELETLKKSGVFLLGLGENRLRTETAALAAAVRIQVLLETQL